MKTVSVDRNKLLDIYKKADATKKQEMEDLYGKEVFVLKPMERIGSYEDACEDQKIDPKEQLPWKSPVNDDHIFDNTVAEMRIVAKSLKGETKVNWADPNEKKWRCVFEYDPKTSAFVFASSHYGLTGTDASVGSRFAFPDQETADYFGSRFIDKHNILLLK